MDTADTTGQHHDAHHMYSKQFVSFFCSCESCIFQRAGEYFATSASAKQKPVHCSRLIARKISDKNTDIDYHAVPPPEYLAGSGSKWENLCQQDSQRVTRRQLEHQAPGNGKRLGHHQDFGNRLLLKILQMKRKFIFNQTLMETSTSGSSMILQRASRSADFTIKYWTVFVQYSGIS